MIVEREQQGEKRARHGTKLIKGLSEYLTEKHGRGFSVVNLQSIRKFYLVYSPSIGQTVSALSEKSDSQINGFDSSTQKQQTVSAKFNLGWSHYNSK
jgi:malic enzyme